MRLLLDTHVLVWMLQDDPLLSKRARDLLADESNALAYSDVSLWEIALKNQAHPGQGMDEKALDRFCADSDIGHLAIDKLHIFATADLPPVHSDPFDRLLIAQALCERMSLVTHDGRIAQYELGCIIPV